MTAYRSSTDSALNSPQVQDTSSIVGIGLKIYIAGRQNSAARFSLAPGTGQYDTLLSIKPGQDAKSHLPRRLGSFRLLDYERRESLND
jgi:hypothetical protein